MRPRLTNIDSEWIKKEDEEQSWHKWSGEHQALEEMDGKGIQQLTQRWSACGGRRQILRPNSTKSLRNTKRDPELLRDYWVESTGSETRTNKP